MSAESAQARAKTGRERVRVVRYDPRMRLLWYVGLALLAALLVGASYRFGMLRGQKSFAAIVAANADLATRLQAAQQERERSAQQVANLGRTVEIDRAATAELRSDMASMRTTLARVQQELTIYKSLMDNTVRTRGLGVHQLDVRSVGENAYAFELILIQRAQNPARLDGTANLALTGTQDGKPRTLQFAEIADPQSTPGSELPKIGFVYFQIMSGQLRLPAGFEPARVDLDLRVAGRRPQHVEKSLDWSVREE